MSKTILVVDDSAAQRTQVRKELEAAGFSVVEGAHGEEGLRIVQDHPDISLIICDVNMPIMDGLTMCSKISELGIEPKIPVFMLTSEGLQEQKQKAKEFGVVAWILKPFNSEKLINAVKKVTQV